MNNLSITSSKTTPEVDFNFDSGILNISGESYPENSADFYSPVFEWLNMYINKTKPVIFNFKLHYFNTSSSKAIMDIIALLENYYLKGGKVSLNWYYEVDDDDIMDSGLEFTENLKMPTKIIEYSE
jgi:hypothetical protein